MFRLPALPVASVEDASRIEGGGPGGGLFVLSIGDHKDMWETIFFWQIVDISLIAAAPQTHNGALHT